jgi:hypothetical protein
VTRGRCQCGELVDLVVVDGKFTSPGHVCRRGASAARTTASAARSARTSVDAPFAPVAALQRRTLRLWLPRAVRSAEGPNGRAWKARARAAAEWRQLVAAALEVLGDRRPRWERASIRYHLFTCGREIDPDNRVALGKPILDGLVAGGVLPDDRGAHVAGVTATWARSPLPWGFVVAHVVHA